MRTVHTDQHTSTHYEDVKGEKVYDRKKEYVVYCTKCNAVIRMDWEEESKTQNYKGGEVLRESASLESVKYN